MRVVVALVRHASFKRVELLPYEELNAKEPQEDIMISGYD
jgi:hypothetical protein